MFVFQNISHLNSNLIDILKYTGFIAIFTVISGGILELIDFIVGVFHKTFFIIYKCLKTYCGFDIKRRRKVNQVKKLSNQEKCLDSSMIPVKVVKRKKLRK